MPTRSEDAPDQRESINETPGLNLKVDRDLTIIREIGRSSAIFFHRQNPELPIDPNAYPNQVSVASVIGPGYELLQNAVVGISPDKPESPGVTVPYTDPQTGNVRWICWQYKGVFKSNDQLDYHHLLGIDVTGLMENAFCDELSGLYNRRYYNEQKANAAGRRNPIAVGMIDLDGLKRVNDTHGHQVGDELIVAAAQFLRTIFRAGDIIARLGGDEFAVLLGNGDHLNEEALVKKHAEIESKLKQFNTERIVAGLSALKFSLGFALAPLADDVYDVEAAEIAADKAMYAEKELHHAENLV
jgi:diguanylate cyclase (GGDEF)-like protein